MDEWKEQIGIIKRQLKQADTVVIGAGAGMSAAAGLTYSGERFEKNFGEFIARYGIQDMYSAGFYPFSTPREKWAYWSRHIYINRYDVSVGRAYQDLYELVKDKNYFVLTTNVDHQFWMSGFEDHRIFATQGDYGLFQCARACHPKLYSNESQVRDMVKAQKNCMIPESMIPRCPVCGGEMEVNLRKDGSFVEDDKWQQASDRYQSFLQENLDKRSLLVELGVGMNTPGIIKFPFWEICSQHQNAFYVCINLNEAWAPEQIRDRSVCISGGIAEVLKEWKEGKNGPDKEA